ncbi:ASG1 [Candida theae]|uniref:ASG1 n=1 Tax=Candida theae TaxID=1198502 RepID=A0AAD5BI06_9ASCO|nr:ASG1 [Candida theae]KAI5963895.1 ASG1 [Candida theae]
MNNNDNATNTSNSSSNSNSNNSSNSSNSNSSNSNNSNSNNSKDFQDLSPLSKLSLSGDSTPMSITSSSSKLNKVTKPSTTEPKRKRVTRACDTCRAKKVKCDGRQPCIHCTVYSFRCTYNEPNIRNKKNSGIPKPSSPNVVAALHAAAANGTLYGDHHHHQGNGTPTSATVAHNASFAVGNESNRIGNTASPEAAGVATTHISNGVSVDSFPTKNLIIAQQIINAVLPKLQFNCLDPNLEFDLDRFQKVISYTNQKLPSSVFNGSEIADLMLDKEAIVPPPRKASTETVSEDYSATTPREVKLILPSKEEALELIYTTWNKACVLFRFYHRPSLIQEIDLLYSLDPSEYGDRQQKFLPFLYSSLACGCLFSKSPYTKTTHNENLEDDGFKYFLEARKLMDITNVGDISSIQTIVMMIMYLQCSARLSTCYSYIGIALRSALKEGLHRNLSIFQNSKRKLDPMEIDTRKRLFFTIYKMDIYINSLLGLPRSLTEDQFDQELPDDLDDENVTREGYLYDRQGGRLSSAGCANYHTKLMFILSHILKELYPVKIVHTEDNKFYHHERQQHPQEQNHHSRGSPASSQVSPRQLPQQHYATSSKPEPFTSSSTTSTSNLSKNSSTPTTPLPSAPDRIHTKVTELEMELKVWLDSLPRELKPTDPNVKQTDIPKKFILANYYLHLSFLNCQIMLYRPFIHFVSDSMNGSLSDPRSLIRGRNCIKIARMVVKLANKMIDEQLLIGTYWFSMYTIFFSIACLMYYFHFANYNNNGHGVNAFGVLFDDDLNVEVIKKDIEIGKKVLDSLKNSSNSSLRIYNMLNTLFEQLNRRTASKTVHKKQQPQQQQQQNANILLQENVQSTFKNFDENNKYMHDAKKDELSEFFKDASIARFQSTSEIPKDLANIEKLSVIKEEDNEEIGGNTGAGLTSNYMPGVFDKLDAQIFGKILPPYMYDQQQLPTNQQQPPPQQQQLSQQQQLQHFQHPPQQFASSTGQPIQQFAPYEQEQGSNIYNTGNSFVPNTNKYNPDEGLNFEEIFGALDGFAAGNMGDGGVGENNPIDYLAPF